MNTATATATVIDKEFVRDLSFPKDDVLLSMDERRKRRLELDRALILGNVDHSKVKIYFTDNEGFKQVETTIWAVTEERIILKSGMVIPIRRIHEVIT
ncbi:MAG TPA: hypothetical protein VK826_14255 [Bacteroidia bacterium]|nr:hypothetical protein [Bacteroidia bacterium]